jgi:protein TonB
MHGNLITLVTLVASALAPCEWSSAETPEAPQAEPPKQAEISYDYTTPPRPTKPTKPKYPRAAFDKKVQGTVLVEIVIGTDGRVVKPRILESVPGLDEAALDCVRSWRFKPALKDGKPVATVARVPIAFKIS